MSKAKKFVEFFIAVEALIAAAKVVSKAFPHKHGERLSERECRALMDLDYQILAVAKAHRSLGNAAKKTNLLSKYVSRVATLEAAIRCISGTLGRPDVWGETSAKGSALAALYTAHDAVVDAASALSKEAAASAADLQTPEAKG